MGFDHLTGEFTVGKKPVISPPLNFEQTVHVGFDHLTGEFMVSNKPVLSTPLNFEHTVHVGFDHLTGEFTVINQLYLLLSTLNTPYMWALIISQVNLR